MIRQSRAAEAFRRWSIACTLGSLAWTAALPAAAGTDLATLCQDPIEQNGVRYARKALGAVRHCTGGSVAFSVSSCLSNEFAGGNFSSLRAAWASQVAAVCASVDLHGDLGYH